MTQAVPRRTIYIPDSVEELVREHARKGESFSATIARLIEQGALTGNEEDSLDYFGSFEGPGDLGINLEKYLGIKPWGPDEKPGEWPGDKGPR